MISLLKLTENDKRILIALFLVFILALVILGYLYVIIKKVMKKQGKAVDNYMYDLVSTHVVESPRHFRAVARKKNDILFFKRARIPALIFAVTAIIILIYCIISGNFDLRVLFSQDKGFASLIITFDWKNVPKATLLGIKTFIPADWPPVAHQPVFLYNSFSAWISYFTVPALIISVTWYLINVQAYIARSLRARKMSKEVFSKDLERLRDAPIQ